MKPITDVVNAIGGLIGGLTLPAREKKELEAKMQELVYEREREMVEAQASVVRAEASGNWLQRSWRPLVMLTFAGIVLVGTFTSLPILADTSRFWDLLEIGLGGYVIGRSGEKMAEAIFKLKTKRYKLKAGFIFNFQFSIFHSNAQVSREGSCATGVSEE